MLDGLVPLLAGRGGDTGDGLGHQTKVEQHRNAFGYLRRLGIQIRGFLVFTENGQSFDGVDQPDPLRKVHVPDAGERNFFLEKLERSWIRSIRFDDKKHRRYNSTERAVARIELHG